MDVVIAVLADLAEIAGHLADSHTWRSESTQRRVSELLAGVRERIEAAAEPPAGRHSEDAEGQDGGGDGETADSDA